MSVLITSYFMTQSSFNVLDQSNTSSVNPVTSNNSIDITTNSTISGVDKRMVDISISNSPEDIAALAYILGYPLVTMQRSFDYFKITDTIAKGILGAGPENYMTFARKLVNASFKDVVGANTDTLYGISWLNLTSEPVVLSVPSVEDDRYYSFEFLDVYTDAYAYVGSRTSGFDGGTYLIAGPQWTGEIPDVMTKIWTPNNLNWMINRILVKGPGIVSNVHAIQDQIKVAPLSVYLANTTSSVTPAGTSQNRTVTKTMSVSTAAPINHTPKFIPTTGIKIFDEIGKAMTVNPQYPPDVGFVQKIVSIGIGPGKVPSIEANDTIKWALEIGITEGENMIAAKLANIGTIMNGWNLVTKTGIFGTNYLFRAAIVQSGFGANVGLENTYTVLFADSEGKPLSGSNNYTIHFEPGQTTPVDAFWSITLYNNTSLLADNPINRYNVGIFTGLKNNTDGSVEFYIQNTNPGPEKESNWLPSTGPSKSFSLKMHLYLPEPDALDGTRSPPPAIRAQ